MFKWSTEPAGSGIYKNIGTGIYNGFAIKAIYYNLGAKISNPQAFIVWDGKEVEIPLFGSETQQEIENEVSDWLKCAVPS